MSGIPKEPLQTSEVERPSITKVVPNSNFVGGQVTIYGHGFAARTNENTVTFNGVAAPILSSSTTEFLVQVPNGATTGHIYLSTPAGHTHSPSVFTVL
jgi:hypothetical protein